MTLRSLERQVKADACIFDVPPEDIAIKTDGLECEVCGVERAFQESDGAPM